MIFELIVLFLTVRFNSAQAPEEFFKVCSKNDSNLGQCITDSINGMRESMKKGIPKLKIAPLDPMIVPKIGVKQGSGPVSIDSTFFNLKINGMTNYKLIKVEPKLDQHKITFYASLPYLFNEGEYSINGRILVLPITGKGDSWSNYTDVNIKAVLQGSPHIKNGRTYMKINDFKFDLNVKKAIIHMENLFNGNKELGEAMNRFMSENWEVVFNELKPVVDQAVTALLKDVALKIFDRFSMDQLFKE